MLVDLRVNDVNMSSYLFIIEINILWNDYFLQLIVLMPSYNLFARVFDFACAFGEVLSRPTEALKLLLNVSVIEHINVRNSKHDHYIVHSNNYP